MATTERAITRDDIKAKFSELEVQAQDTAESARNVLITVGVGTVAVIGALAFLLGRRKGKKEKTVVEIRRV
jgi:uncharacterized membrane protein